jgi:hypothetical protein
MSNYNKIIQKLTTIHSDVKNTNEKVDKINEKVNKLDIILRGNGTSSNIGIVAKVTENSEAVKNFKKIEKKVAIIVIVLAILLLGGYEGARTIISVLTKIP